MEVESLLNPKVVISREYGILTICWSGYLPPHAFIVFEYISNSEERILKRLDFRPDGLVNCIIGKGKVSVVNASKEESTTFKRGPFWRLKVEDVLSVPGFKTDILAVGTEIKVEDLSNDIYSSAGDSVESFCCFSTKKVNNCMTYVRRYVETYKDQLGIQESEEQMNKMFKWKKVPIHLPNIMVPLYRRNQN